jgi:hypothetical protein
LLGFTNNSTGLRRVIKIKEKDGRGNVPNNRGRGCFWSEEKDNKEEMRKKRVGQRKR